MKIIAHAINQRKQLFWECQMGIGDDAVEVRAQGWRTLAALHGLIEYSGQTLARALAFF